MRKWLIPGIVAAVLLLGGAVFGYWTLKQSRPAPFWVEMKVRVPPEDEQLKKLEKEIRERLLADAVILPVVRDLNLAREWKLPGEQAAAAELRKRVFVQFSSSGVLKIGATGKRKETAMTQQIATRLGKKFMEAFQPAGRPSF